MRCMSFHLQERRNNWWHNFRWQCFSRSNFFFLFGSGTSLSILLTLRARFILSHIWSLWEMISSSLVRVLFYSDSNTLLLREHDPRSMGDRWWCFQFQEQLKWNVLRISILFGGSIDAASQYRVLDQIQDFPRAKCGVKSASVTLNIINWRHNIVLVGNRLNTAFRLKNSCFCCISISEISNF